MSDKQDEGYQRCMEQIVDAGRTGKGIVLDVAAPNDRALDALRPALNGGVSTQEIR